tara:strand:- start:215 stop:886 length:672 start_codon:yes stop_codon:yes gene_type:complete
MKKTNKKAFLEFEANSYFDRNYDYLTNFNNKNDIIVKLIDDYSLKFKTICELGCSAGGRLDFIEKKYNPKKIIGVDPSQNAINHGKTINKNIIFHQGTSDDLYFIDDQSVDLLILGFFLYVVDRELLLKSFSEIDRILKKNGNLIIVDFYSSTPLKSKYSHLIKENAYLFKQKYHETLLSTNEYELIDFRSLDSKSMSLNATKKSNDLASISLLRKSFDRHIV